MIFEIFYKYNYQILNDFKLITIILITLCKIIIEMNFL